MAQWISVKHRLPRVYVGSDGSSEEVLIAVADDNDDGFVSMSLGYVGEDGQWYCCSLHNSECQDKWSAAERVTHWMPLPDPPNWQKHRKRCENCKYCEYVEGIGEWACGKLFGFTPRLDSCDHFSWRNPRDEK